jgi:hypothetical protein
MQTIAGVGFTSHRLHVAREWTPEAGTLGAWMKMEMTLSLWFLLLFCH